MSLIPTIYSSTDAGAPALSGTVGSYIALLRAILVNGYGTGPAAKVGMGWTEEATATNKAVFRNNQITGSGYRLRVLDDGTAAAGGSARSATVRAYSSMSSIDAGSDPTPTVAQLANGTIIAKSATANASARAWWAIGNERAFYILVDARSEAADGSFVPYFAGDLISLVPGDLNAFALSFCALTSYAAGTEELTRLWGPNQAWNVAVTVGNAAFIVARDGSASAGSVPVASLTLEGNMQNAAYGLGGYAYPLPVTGGLVYARPLLVEAPSTPRGYMPGCFAPGHNLAFTDLQVLTGVAGLPSGAQLLAKRYAARGALATYATRGQILFLANGEWT